VASADTGLWYARSAEFLQQPWLQALRWLRMPGDSLFLIGVGAFAWFMAGLWRGWSYEGTGETVPTGRPVPARVTVTLLRVVALLLAPSRARAHCDTLDGPAVTEPPLKGWNDAPELAGRRGRGGERPYPARMASTGVRREARSAG
jgi:hypothetical protein